MNWLPLLAVAATLVVLALMCVAYRRLRSTRRARLLPDGTQEARVIVDHGYRPSRVDLDVGVPTTLRFDRREDDPCTEMLVSELWPNAHRLAAHGETRIRFTPERAGRFVFTCGMGMYSGQLVIHEGRKVV